MSVIVAKSLGSGGGVAPPYQLYDENPVSIVPPDAAGDNSIALGSGAHTAPTASNALAIGNQSLARHPGAVVMASGRFNSTGDIQHGKYILRTVSTTGVPMEAFINGVGGTERLVLPDDSTWTFRITVTAHSINSNHGHAGYEAKGVIYRGSGPSTTSLQGGVSYTTLASSDPLWWINITADTVNGALGVMVKGAAADIIRWAVLVETLEVTN